MEKRDLYDGNKKLTGLSIYKDEEIPKNNYILIVVLISQNEENKFLIQKRSKIKDGLWAFTGGHPKIRRKQFGRNIYRSKRRIRNNYK